MNHSVDLQVYWLPGCSSCLRAKEFLKQRGFAFESINVAVASDAMSELARLGARSVPVVRRGEDWTFAQDLKDLADFLGVGLAADFLPPGEYITKLGLLLDAAQRYLAQLSDEQLAQNFPGRDRPYRNLAYHIFMIPLGFLEAARGGTLEYEVFERVPPHNQVSAAAIAAVGDRVKTNVLDWWSNGAVDIPDMLNTYYGEQSAISVLERTTWHTAQHCRQLQEVVTRFGIKPNGPLTDAELAGLPLPEEVYDDEVTLDG